MPKVGDMIRSTPANEDPCQGDMVKVRNPSIPQDMAVLVSLHMQIETLMLIMMFIKVYVPGEFRRTQICGTRWG